MRKFLLSVITAMVALTANALEIKRGPSLRVHNNATETISDNSFKNKYGLGSMPNANITPTVSISSFGQKSADTDGAELVTEPQGLQSRYAMATDIFLSHLGATHVGGFGAEFITSEDGKYVYTRALTLNFFQQGYSEGEIEGVSGIQSAIETNQKGKWYNLQGVEVSNPAPGSIYIQKQGDKTTKIFVK